jgi:hypothetical protein
MSARDERELVGFASRLSSGYRDVAVPAEFRARLRSSLLSAPVAFATARRSPFAWSQLARRPVIASFLALALLAAAGGGAAAAASLPGDPAFALKRGVEEVQVALAPDEIARLDTLVTQADSRLADLETLTALRSNAVTAGADEYLAASSRVDASVTRVAALSESTRRDAALARAASVSAGHLARLEALATRLPEAAQNGIQRAIEVQQTLHGKSGGAPGRGGSPPTSPTTPTVPTRPTPVPVTPPGRGGPPSGGPGRP